ncbi:uncharacterized protein LOC119330432 [Triticum dicoccoides]|uniref:uncharacterized protein LOC119330432 n=1 Tax=Triticum dicoccoides TaxID=85692 RepID=UPI001891506D|nr:uncharacterized protein LOC119330432 [Triticum dicoccoides]
MESAEAGGGIAATRSGLAAVQAAKDAAAASMLCDEHVGDTAQPPSAQAVQELVDSFSEQQLDATEIQESMHGGIGKQAKNNTIFSPKRVGGGSYREMLANEERFMATRRSSWEHLWSRTCGSLENYTFMTPILYTYGTIPAHVGPCAFLQIFSIQVMENEEWKIRWPVEVYGFIAARDTVDHNRNLLFSRTRDDPQILTQQDSFLKLTGPCRPIVLIDPVDFEIQLQVKGTTECEDETLMARWFEYSHGFGCYGELACRRWDGNFSTIEVTSALLARTVVATIISADIIEGSWPDDSRGRVVARTAAIDKDILLLDSGEEPLKVDPDGRVTLQRGVVCVERQGKLTVSMKAYSKEGIFYADSVEFRPKKSLTSIGICNLGFCTVQFIVGWSPMATKSDLMYFGN